MFKIASKFKTQSPKYLKKKSKGAFVNVSVLGGGNVYRGDRVKTL